MTKKEELSKKILDACERLAGEPLTDRDKIVLKEFVGARLTLHGRDGYLFKTVRDFSRDFISPYFVGADEEIAKYVLECNHKKF